MYPGVLRAHVPPPPAFGAHRPAEGQGRNWPDPSQKDQGHSAALGPGLRGHGQHLTCPEESVQEERDQNPRTGILRPGCT